MIMFDYKGEGGVKNLGKSDYVICKRSLNNETIKVTSASGIYMIKYHNSSYLLLFGKI